MESKLSFKICFFTYKDFSSNNIKVNKCVKKNTKYICFYNRNMTLVNVTLVKENKDTGFISSLTGGTKIAD